MTQSQYQQCICIPVPAAAIPIVIEYIRRLQDITQHFVSAGHGYVAVHHVDANMAKAFMETSHAEVHLTSMRIPARLHVLDVSIEAATAKVRLECPSNGFHLTVLLDTRGAADMSNILKAVQKAVSFQVSVAMVEAWDHRVRRYATMAAVQGQAGCQDALKELLSGARKVLIGSRECRVLPYSHARASQTKDIPDNDYNAALHAHRGGHRQPDQPQR
eukprot:6965583-Heterocapsa_arctica.AAC.1